MPPKIDHPALVDLLRRAYSGERAAAFAYIGHAGSLRRRETERVAVRQIEEDEWDHRRQVRRLMDQYEIAPSRWYELKFHLIGKIFHWGPDAIANDVDLESLKPVPESKSYCRTREKG